MDRAFTKRPEAAWPSTLPQPAQVMEVRSENERTRTLVLDLSLDAQPGQFVMVWLPGIDEKPFSLAGAHLGRAAGSGPGIFGRAVGTCRPFTKRYKAE